ncbi:hypothetical protein V8C37DRAFT_373783 [Trichoderma ceciliae]
MSKWANSLAAFSLSLWLPTQNGAWMDSFLPSLFLLFPFSSASKRKAAALATYPGLIAVSILTGRPMAQLQLDNAGLAAVDKCIVSASQSTDLWGGGFILFLVERRVRIGTWHIQVIALRPSLFLEIF